MSAALDPLRVKESPLTKFDVNYKTATFERLKESIFHLGCNVDPIKVRTVRIEGADGPAQYEIVFGHARLQACAELGLPVRSVVVDSMPDPDLVIQFITHVRFAVEWQPWRLGAVLDRALVHGLFSSLRRAAESLHVDTSEASLLIKLARLPDPIRLAFRSAKMTPAVARRLIREHVEDPDGLLRRAEGLGDHGPGSATAMVKQLATRK